MFLDESGVTTLFKVINLCAFIFLMCYVFKNYLIETIKKQIEDKRQAMDDLHNQANVLVDDIRVIEQRVQQDEQICHQLKIRVVEWRTRAERIVQERVIQKKEQANRLIDRVHTQTKYLARNSAYERILPQVIDQTHKKLEQKFENELLGQEFIDQLIISMQKR